jgi:hypothetical protein
MEDGGPSQTARRVAAHPEGSARAPRRAPRGQARPAPAQRPQPPQPPQGTLPLSALLSQALHRGGYPDGS